MANKGIFIGGNPGITESSLEDLEEILKEFSLEQRRGKKILIYELHNPKRKDINHIGFYLTSGDLSGYIPHSFWTPKETSESREFSGGEGLLGYRRSIALMHRYLANQPRKIVEFSDANLSSLEDVQGEVDSLISSLPVKKTIVEDKGINSTVLSDLEGGYVSMNKNFSVIFMDTKARQSRKGTSLKFQLGSTWDFYNGFRSWGENQPAQLAEECNQFDRVVTFNGEAYDLPRVLKRHSFTDADEIKYTKSVDLYRIVVNSLKDQGITQRRRGESTLATLSFATLSLPKDDVFYLPDSKNRDQNIELSLESHCERNVELTKELFFYMVKNGEVYSIFHSAMQEGRVIVQIPVAKRFSEAWTK